MKYTNTNEYVPLNTLINEPHRSNIAKAQGHFIENDDKETGYNYESDSLSNDYLIDVAVQTHDKHIKTKQKPRKRVPLNLQATPIYYTENPRDEHATQYNELGYQNISVLAQMKGNTLKSQFLKATWEHNRHTTFFIFVLDNYYFKTTTWEFIRNAIQNGKVVHVVTPNRKLKNVKMDSKEYAYLYRLFDEKAQERRRYARLKSIKDQQEQIKKDFHIKNENFSQYQKDVITRLAWFYELDVPTSTSDYMLTWETCKAYITSAIPFSREITPTEMDGAINDNALIIPPKMVINGKTYCMIKYYKYRSFDIELFGNFEIAQNEMNAEA